ncbi:bifunctional 3-(3-hydroxy-phenyl)propionate/3-hydroxycinnamic acid hydroxylase [Rubricoccus marinus]|uniref:FAD-binding domain-containing protein n=1 Tax=Rubricoccus marinus TaxID=716817 RepID=A0A259U2L1_9BACT|nr:bifunctional 3-(3-hydroxy-phenyl)propionate/3-hydroxycinnamic acid hydroxylase [Rubricoccus marinus]OZC04190.1 hypothetical protein BSZ36_15095 [Rubricoccus marinus]
METSSYSVAIVGLGPVGAALAALLGEAGVRTVVLERETAPYSLPRAAHLDDEAMRVLQAAGVADEVRARGRTLDGFDLVDARGQTRLRARKAGGTRYGWPTATLIHQPTVERLLRQRIAALPSVDVRLGWEVAEIAQDDEGVALTGASGETVRASYAVGCDGARSRVRAAMDVPLDGGRFEERWLVVDTRLTAPLALSDRLLQIADRERPSTFVPFPGDRRRWEFKLRDDEPDALVTQEAWIRQRLAAHPTLRRENASGGSDSRLPLEIERAAVYTFRDVVARSWRQGRLLLAGDAAHQMPPFLGQGLGAGLRDAFDLAWRLRLVAGDCAGRRSGGASGAALLDGYEAERKPHVRRVTRLAAALGRLVSAQGALGALRDGALALAHRTPLAPKLLDLTLEGIRPVPLATAGAHAPRRSLLPQPDRLDDRLGTNWAILARDPAAWSGAPAHLPGVGLHVLPAPEALGETLGRFDALVVRPDRHVFGRYRAGEGERLWRDLEVALHLRGA